MSELEWVLVAFFYIAYPWKTSTSTSGAENLWVGCRMQLQLGPTAGTLQLGLLTDYMSHAQGCHCPESAPCVSNDPQQTVSRT